MNKPLVHENHFDLTQKINENFRDILGEINKNLEPLISADDFKTPNLFDAEPKESKQTEFSLPTKSSKKLHYKGSNEYQNEYMDKKVKKKFIKDIILTEPSELPFFP